MYQSARALHAKLVGCTSSQLERGLNAWRKRMMAMAASKHGGAIRTPTRPTLKLSSAIASE
jgi:hypothetical protein